MMLPPIGSPKTDTSKAEICSYRLIEGPVRSRALNSVRTRQLAVKEWS